MAVSYLRMIAVKRIPMLLLLLAPYVFLGSCLLQTTEDTGGGLLVVLALFGVVLLGNMVYAFLLPRLGYDGRRILFWNLLLKLCNIPVYLFVFAVALVTNVLIIPMLPFLFLFDYALLLASTMYGISGLLCCCREDKASRKTLVIHSVAQCLFCVDVFSAVYCYIKTRNRGG